MMRLPLGAFDVALDEGAMRYRELLEALFRTRAESICHEGAALQLSMKSGRGETAARDLFGADDTFSCADENGGVRFTSDVLAGRLAYGAPCRLDLWIDDENPRLRHLDHYLRIVLNAALRKLDRMRFHAAAVEHAGAASLFVGDKGAGKTTICLHLARSGGIVLGEDQIMVRKDPDGIFLAAGGDDLMRLTARTEGHYFQQPVDAPAVEGGGIVKKEIRARRYISYTPNVERPLRRLFFPRVGDAFEIRPLGRQEAVRRLATPLLPIHRFTNDRDRIAFLSFLAGLTAQVECFMLTLTPNLDDLQRLTGVLT